MANAFPLNQRVLVSDATYLEPKGINAFEDPNDQPDHKAAVIEHERCVEAFKQAGIKVEQVTSPKDCQDGIFTANWGLTWNGRALLSRLPNLRQAEEPAADAALKNLGFKTKRASVLFSGQGDAMIIGGNRVLIGNGYRTNPAVAKDIKEWLGLEPIVVRARPKRHWFGPRVRNKITGLWDSYFYDLDLAVAVVRPDLIGVCFDALTHEGVAAVKSLKDIEIIPVSLHEARDCLATNSVSNGETMIMVDNAPNFAAELGKRGFDLIRLPNHEIKKSGGGFRCISLALYG